MKKIKGIVLLVIGMIFMVGCGCSVNSSATKAVENYLDRYRNHDQVVLNELDKYIDNEELTDAQKDIYKDIMKKQYRSLKYTITDEKYDGDNAIITVKITVYDLYKTQNIAENYLIENTTEFYDEDNVYDKTLYLDYKLNLMRSTTETVEYTIDIKLEKQDNTWGIVQLSDTDLEKIHGIYNYE